MNADVMLTVGFSNTQVTQGINQMTAQIRRGAAGLNSLVQPLGRITGKANEFQKSLDASTARVIAFGATAGILHNLSSAFKSLVGTAIEMEQSLTSINTLLKVSSKDLADFSSNILRIANATGQSFKDTAAAANEFARQGLGVNQILARTEAAMTLTRLSGLALEESVSSLTATMNSFHRESLTAIEIVNRLANVDAKFAVSSADLAEALKRVGGAAADAGVQFNDVIALVTAAQQATARGGSVIGNSFKTIFTRLQRPAVLDDLEAMGVAVRKSNGETRNLIDILKNLASTYDTLSSGQKSFVSETVGGVYQINILKSVLNDLGNGVSVYGGALEAASESTAAAEERMKALNDTIASKLQKTINNLSSSFAGVSKLTIEPTIRGGLGAFDNIIKVITSATSQNTDGVLSDVFKGIAKGLGNLLAGPGLQFVIFGFFKLFQKLQAFIIDSVKDLTGLNKTANERAAIEKRVNDELTRERDLIQNIRTGAVSLAEVHDRILNTIKAEAAYLQDVVSFTPGVTNNLQSSGARITNSPLPTRAASGYIPNLDVGEAMEQYGAKRGGYTAGNVVYGSVSNGSRKTPIIANAAETMSTLTVGGQSYQWINPPADSQAGLRHRIKSKMATGVDPYSLGQHRIGAAGGLVPNLVNTGSQGDTIHESSILNSKELKDRLNKFNPGDGDVFEQAWKDKTRKPYYTKGALETTLRGILKFRGFGDRYKNPLKPNGLLNNEAELMIKDIAENLGKVNVQKQMRVEDFEMGDIKNMLNLRGPEFAAFSIFQDFNSKQPTSGEGTGFGTADIRGEKIRVPFKTTGLINPMKVYESYVKKTGAGLDDFISDVFGVSGVSNEGVSTKMGIDFDTGFKAFLQKAGVRTASKSNDALDILGYKASAFSMFHPISGGVAGGDIKTSLTGTTPNSMAEKLAKVLAFKRGAGQSVVPLFQNVGKFNQGSGGVGLIDLNFLQERDDYERIAYAALSTGKPFKVQIGAQGSGKMSAALKAGAVPLSEHNDVAKFKQFILNTDRRTGLEHGTLGIAMASASNVVGFNASKEQIAKNLMARMASKPAGFLRGDSEIKQQLDSLSIYPENYDYDSVFSALKKRFGDTGRFSIASGGLIPNLVNALNRENLATGGNGTVSQSGKLVTAFNPLGLAAIDKRSQMSADDAIAQHKALGQSMVQIKTAHSAGGFIPNLSTDASSQIMMTAILASAQWVHEMGSITDNLRSFRSVLSSVINPLSSVARKQNVFIETNKASADELMKWVDSVKEARGHLENGRAVNNNGVQLNTIAEFDEHFKEGLASAGKGLDTFNQALNDRKNNLRKFGIMTALGAGLGGGLASQFAGSTFNSPDAANAIDQFSGGAQLAGQALASFPGKMGKAVASFAILDAAVSGVNAFSSGIEGAKKRLEEQQSRAQKLSSGIDMLSTSISNLTTMVGDSSVSLQAINREQRNYAEALAQIRTSSDRGGLLASEIDSSPTAAGKIEKLVKAKVEIGRDLDTQAGIFQIKNQSADRSVGFGPFRTTALSGGIFGGFTEADRAQSNSILKSNAANLIPQLTESQKSALTGSLKNSGQFQTELQNTDVGGKIIQAIKDEHGTSGDVKAFVDTVRKMIGAEAADTNPKVKSLREKALTQNAASQLKLDAALRNESSYRRTFSNAGVVKSGAILDQSMAGFKAGYNVNQLSNDRLRLQSSQIGLLYGDETVGAHELGVESNRISDEKKMKLKSLSDSTSRKLFEGFAGLNIDEIGKATFNSGPSAAVTGQNLPRVSEQREALIGAYNKGLAGVAQGGDLTRFVGQNGQFNFADFEKEMTSKSGASGDVLNQLQAVLSANRGNLDVMKMVQASTSEQTDILQDSLKEQISANQKFDELKKELDLKRMISFLGGTKNLTDREARRQMERNLTKGGVLMDTGPTLEAKGMGASMFLKALKEMGADLRIAGRDNNGNAIGIRGNAMSQRVASAMNLEAAAVRQQQGLSTGRVMRNLGVGGASNALSMFTNAAFDPRMRNAANAAVANEHRVEGESIISAATDVAGAGMIMIGKELDSASQKLVNFGKGLDDIKKKLDESVVNAGKARTEQKTTFDKNTNMLMDRTALEQQRAGGSEGPELSNMPNLGPAIGKVGEIGSLALLSALGRNSKVQGGIDKTLTGAGNGLSWATKGGKFNPVLFGGGASQPPIVRIPGTTGTSMTGAGMTLGPGQREAQLTRSRDFIRARAEEASRDRFQNQVQNKGLAAIKANELKKAMTWNPLKQPNPNAVGFNAGMPSMGGMGGMIGGAVASQLSDSPFAYAGGMLATQALGPQFAALFGAGGAGAGLAAAPLAGALAVGGTAYGGYKVGQYLGSKTGLGVSDKLNNDIFEGNTEAGKSAATLVQKSLKAGKSTNDIKKLLDAQIQTTLGQIQTGGGGGFFSKLIGTDKATDDLSKSVDEMKALRGSIDALKAAQDDKAKAEGAQDKLIAALEKIASGGGSGSTASIKVEISLKDADKLPDILNAKVIRPLQQQIQNLQTKVGNIEDEVGISPSPATVG